MKASMYGFSIFLAVSSASPALAQTSGPQLRSYEGGSGTIVEYMQAVISSGHCPADLTTYGTIDPVKTCGSTENTNCAVPIETQNNIVLRYNSFLQAKCGVKRPNYGSVSPNYSPPATTNPATGPTGIRTTSPAPSFDGNDMERIYRDLNPNSSQIPPQQKRVIRNELPVNARESQNQQYQEARRKDWEEYEQKKREYEKQLEKYEEELEEYKDAMRQQQEDEEDAAENRAALFNAFSAGLAGAMGSRTGSSGSAGSCRRPADYAACIRQGQTGRGGGGVSTCSHFCN